MSESKSLLVLSQGYIKSYWNYEGEQEVDIFSTDKSYIKGIIPLFDTFMIHATNQKISKNQALEYITMPEEERRKKY